MNRCRFYDPEHVYCSSGCVGVDFVAHCGKYRELSEMR